MAHAIKVSTEAADVKANAFAAALDGGKILIYNGAKPATANTAISGQTLLGTLTLGSPAFGASVAGLITAEAITKESDANATLAAQFYRLTKSDDTPMGDGEIGVTGSGSDLEMPTTAIVLHGEITCSGFTHQENLG